MNPDICHALTLRIAEKTIKEMPSNIVETLGSQPTSKELQNSIQYLSDKGLLVSTEAGWFVSSLAKTLFSEDFKLPFTQESISALSTKIQKA